MDWIIEGVIDHPLLMVEANSTTVTFDKAFDAIADIPPSFLDIGTNVSFDRAIMPEMVADEIYLFGYPTKDWAMEAVSEVLGDAGIGMFPKKTISAKCESDTSSHVVLPFIVPSLDVANNVEISGGDIGIEAIPSSDRCDLGEIEGMALRIEIEYVERAILTIPPDGVITILNSASRTTGESKFDNSKIEKGVTTILQAEVLGSRLDSYLIEFFARTSESDLPFIHKSSDKSKGGITIQSITPAPDAPGSRQLAILQIAIRSEDTFPIEKTHTCLYDFRFSNRGMGEDYRVAPRKENGDTGTFTIIV